MRTTRGRAFAAAAVALMATVAIAQAKYDDTGKKLFVQWDPGLQKPAICYVLDPGWTGIGRIMWNMRADTKFLMMTILASPEKHQIVETVGPMLMQSEILTPQRLLEFQNPGVMAQNFAADLNKNILVPGLSDIVATGGKFTKDASPLAKASGKGYETGTGLTQVSVFGFEASLACNYGGVRCEGTYLTSFAVAITSAPHPRVPKVCNYTRAEQILVIAPPGKQMDALRNGGKMFASAFVNRAWSTQRDSTLNALIKGTQLGREAGWNIWMQSQAETSATLDRVRKGLSEQIRDVMTVDNPFDPEKKVERPAFFKNSWINSRQDMMILSDNSLEPNIIRGLMEQGEWLPMK